MQFFTKLFCDVSINSFDRISKVEVENGIAKIFLSLGMENIVISISGTIYIQSLNESDYLMQWNDFKKTANVTLYKVENSKLVSNFLEISGGVRDFDRIFHVCAYTEDDCVDVLTTEDFADVTMPNGKTERILIV